MKMLSGVWKTLRPVIFGLIIELFYWKWGGLAELGVPEPFLTVSQLE